MELPICALAFVIFSVWFPAIGGNIVTLSPSPEAKVTEGDNLKLQCDFSGSYTPDTVNWYLNNDTLGYVLLATDCSEASVPPLYGSGRYNKTCSIPSFSLQIQNVTISMDGDIWSCDTTSIGNSPPSKVSTRIKVNKRTTTSTQPPGPPCLCPQGWCIGLIVADGIIVLAVIIGICIFCCRIKHIKIKKQKRWKKITIVIFLLVVIIIAIMIVFAWFVCSTCRIG